MKPLIEISHTHPEIIYTPANKLLVKNQLLKIVPYSISHIWRLEQEGAFPKRIKIGKNRVAWLASEVDAWVDAKVRDRPDFSTEGDS